ncbi:Hypothetical predicted protein [Paramuricea clavata]|uniref:Uncharacterized protein n=1 Tax=Paramuricea clavata TaxID=317549 RepID=A0A6S7H4V6_PARCT|nr:Hypothetical predicted protein [Paramuricea clavata]
MAMSAETERVIKFSLSGRNLASISTVEMMSEKKNKEKREEGRVFAVLKAVQSDMATMQSEIKFLRDAASKVPEPGDDMRNNVATKPSRPNRGCKECEEKGTIPGLGDSADTNMFVSYLTPKQRDTVVKPVGEKCQVKCQLNVKETEMRWDTGAQVSILPERILKDMFPDIPDNDPESALVAVAESFDNVSNAEVSALVNFMNSDLSESLCAVRTSKKKVVIFSGQTINISCRANTGPIRRNSPALFEPDEQTHMPIGLTVQEALTTVKQGKSSLIDIPVTNTTQHDIVLPDRLVLATYNWFARLLHLESNYRRKNWESSQAT